MTSLRDHETASTTAMITEVTGPSRQDGTRACPVNFEEPVTVTQPNAIERKP